MLPRPLIIVLVVLIAASAVPQSAAAVRTADGGCMKGSVSVCLRAGTLAFGSVALTLSASHIAG